MTRLNVLDIDRIEVATPCTAEWADMVGDDRSRLCLSCEKNVYNFAAMTRREIAELIVETEGKFCGRLFRRKDGRVLTADCPLGIRERVEIAASRLGLWVFLGVVTLFTAVLAFVPHRKTCTLPVVTPTVVVEEPGVDGRSHIDVLRARAEAERQRLERRLEETQPMPGGMMPPPQYRELKGDVAFPE